MSPLNFVQRDCYDHLLYMYCVVCCAKLIIVFTYIDVYTWNLDFWEEPHIMTSKSSRDHWPLVKSFEKGLPYPHACFDVFLWELDTIVLGYSCICNLNKSCVKGHPGFILVIGLFIIYLSNSITGCKPYKDNYIAPENIPKINNAITQ